MNNIAHEGGNGKKLYAHTLRIMANSIATVLTHLCGFGFYFSLYVLFYANEKKYFVSWLAICKSNTNVNTTIAYSTKLKYTMQQYMGIPLQRCLFFHKITARNLLTKFSDVCKSKGSSSATWHLSQTFYSAIESL